MHRPNHTGRNRDRAQEQRYSSGTETYSSGTEKYSSGAETYSSGTESKLRNRVTAQHRGIAQRPGLELRNRGISKKQRQSSVTEA